MPIMVAITESHLRARLAWEYGRELSDEDWAQWVEEQRQKKKKRDKKPFVRPLEHLLRWAEGKRRDEVAGVPGHRYHCPLALCHCEIDGIPQGTWQFNRRFAAMDGKRVGLRPEIQRVVELVDLHDPARGDFTIGEFIAVLNRVQRESRYPGRSLTVRLVAK